MNYGFVKKDFYEQVWDLVRLIPYGRVTTYGAIARAIGHPNAARRVGYALTSRKFNLDGMPAHRVVNSKGVLTGSVHFIIKPMYQLLEEEGVEVMNQNQVDLERYFWSPWDLEGTDIL